VGFGLFSYSFYLVHSPIIGWVNLATRHIDIGTGPRFVGLLVVGLPLSTACAYGFYLLIERHFMSGHMAQVDAGSSPSAQGGTPSGAMSLANRPDMAKEVRDRPWIPIR
jgi:peptidoglycan/LPS O-acetylase OafA/YrhL